MKKIISRTMIITSIICLIPFFISTIFYKSLPDQVATHFGFNGMPDGYSSKMFAAFGLPLIMLVINFISNFTIDNDPKKANASKRIKIIGKWTVPILSVLMQSSIITNAVGIKISISMYVSIGLGILIMIIGNYLPKCKQNYTVGIKTPWTLNNEEVWNKTHKISGYLWVVGGFIITISSFIGFESIMFIVLIIIAVAPILYSYILYKNMKHLHQ